MAVNSAYQSLLKLPKERQEALVRALEAASRKARFFHRRTKHSRPSPHPIALTPYVLDSRLLPKLKGLCRVVHRFQSLLPELYRQNRLSVRKICPLDKKAESWLLKFRRPSRSRGADLLIRLDVGFSEEGGSLNPVLYESNSTALAGLYNHSVGARMLKELVFPKIGASLRSLGLREGPDLMEFLREWVCRHARRASAWPSEGGCAAFLEELPYRDGFSELPRIARYFEEKGMSSSHGDPRELKTRGNILFLRGRKVDLVYRDMPFYEIGPVSRAEKNLSGFARMIEEGKVIPGFSGEFDQKGLLECLTSEEYSRFFSRKESRLLKECVPWTRVLWERRTRGPEGHRVDLVSYALRHRENLILKPNDDCGGEGLAFGKALSQSRWERKIQSALRKKGHWVLQQFKPGPAHHVAYYQRGSLDFKPCHSTLGLFYFKDKMGLHCRVSSEEIVNVGRSGALACVFLK